MSRKRLQREKNLKRYNLKESIFCKIPSINNNNNNNNNNSNNRGFLLF